MNISYSIFIATNGLFDFDLTFPTQALLFLILSIITSNFFLKPIANEIDTRGDFINYSSKSSMILINLGFEKLSSSIQLISSTTEELLRQNKIVKIYASKVFDEEVTHTQKTAGKIVNKLKGALKIKSAFIFSSLIPEVNSLTKKFFEKKFSQ